MNKLTTLMTGCVFCTFGAAAAQANCADKLAKITGKTSGGATEQESTMGAAKAEEDVDTATTGAGLSDSGGETSDMAAEAPEDGIAKDGSLAPLETGKSAGADAAASESSEETDLSDAGEEMASTDATGTDTAGATSEASAATDSPGAAEESVAGGTAISPIEGTDTTDQAMSGQDAEAQQDSEPTAAETADAESGDAAGIEDGSIERDQLIEQAQTALSEGDEEACLKALEEVAAL